jgi:hypothetical protein
MAKSQSWNTSDDPQVAAERATLAELQSKLDDAQRQAEQSGDSDPNGIRSAFEIAVDRELGKDVAPAAPALEQSEAMQRYRILAVAIERQRQIVSEAEHAASLRIADAVLPEYVAILKRIKAVVIPLRAAIGDEMALRERLADGGVSPSALTVCPFRHLTPAGIDHWLSELADKFAI